MLIGMLSTSAVRSIASESVVPWLAADGDGVAEGDMTNSGGHFREVFLEEGFLENGTVCDKEMNNRRKKKYGDEQEMECERGTVDGINSENNVRICVMEIKPKRKGVT